MLRQLATRLKESSDELEVAFSRGNYRQALVGWRKLRHALDQASRLSAGCAGPPTLEYRAALLEVRDTLQRVRVRATLERDRVGRALNHCRSLRQWVDANRNTF